MVSVSRSVLLSCIWFATEKDGRKNGDKTEHGQDGDDNTNFSSLPCFEGHAEEENSKRDLE